MGWRDCHFSGAAWWGHTGGESPIVLVLREAEPNGARARNRLSKGKIEWRGYRRPRSMLFGALAMRTPSFDYEHEHRCAETTSTMFLPMS